MMKAIFAIAAAIAAAFAGVPAAAASLAPTISADSSGLGAKGYDPVAYFTQGKAVKGSATHHLEWSGATWRFASAASLETFKANPARYAPQFGGYCAWAVSQHYLAPGDPNFWTVVDGKLYLNANARAKQLWEADQAQAIARGHSNWPAVLSDNQESAAK
jgi:YHS domain-containing protein